MMKFASSLTSTIIIGTFLAVVYDLSGIDLYITNVVTFLAIRHLRDR